jgi:hypothetical protein
MTEAGEYAHETSLSDDLAREAPAPFWTVAIYLADRVYGGPEEGGWWYEAGYRIDHLLHGINPNSLLTVFDGEGTRYQDTEEQTAAEQEAHEYAANLQVLLDVTVNVGRRDIGSVLSSGRYYARAYPGHPPAHYPATRPHYE